MGDAKFLLSWVSSVTSVCVQLVGVQICFRIVRKGNPGDLSNVPFISLFVAACVWLRYGLLTHVTAVVFVNGTAAFLQFCYMTVYYTYSVQRSSLYKQYLFACVALFSVLAYVKFYAPDEATAVTYLGLIGCLFTVFGYGAPLATLKHVLRTKSTDSMSLLMCSANLLVATEWLLYGYLLKDTYIALPNVFGIGLAFLQLYLFIKFPSRRSASKPIVA